MRFLLHYSTKQNCCLAHSSQYKTNNPLKQRWEQSRRRIRRRKWGNKGEDRGDTVSTVNLPAAMCSNIQLSAIPTGTEAVIRTIHDSKRAALTESCWRLPMMKTTRIREIITKSNFNSPESTIPKIGSKFYSEQQTVTAQINTFQKEINRKSYTTEHIPSADTLWSF